MRIWGNRAKRTQFPATEVSHHSNIPLFQHSSPDADRAKQSQWAGSGWAKGAVRGTHPTNRDQLCKTKPISSVGQGPGGRNAQNKPNWPSAARGRTGPVVRNKANRPRKGRAGTPNPRRADGQSCETKPIRRGAMWKASTVWKRSYNRLDPGTTSAKQSQFPAGPVVQTNPIPGAVPIGRSVFRGAVRAKQSQTWAA